MAAGDEFLFETAKRGCPLEPDRPRGDRLPPAGARGLPRAPRGRPAALSRSRSKRSRTSGQAGGLFWRSDQPDTILSRSVQVLKLHVGRAQATAADRRRARPRASARKGSRASSRCSRGARRRLPAGGRAAPARARVQARRARERRARQGQQGPPLHGPRAAARSAGRERLPFGNRSAELQLHDPAPRRERLQGAGGDPRQGASTTSRTRSRNRPITSRASSPCSGSSSPSTSAA